MSTFVEVSGAVQAYRKKMAPLFCFIWTYVKAVWELSKEFTVDFIKFVFNTEFL